MDSVTHLVLGAAIGEAMLGKRLGKRAMLWGALANSLPDIDVFFVPFFDGTDALGVHRGITHSILFCMLSSAGLAWWFSKMKWKRQAPFREWLLFFLVAVNGHIVLDAFTAYGTGWFEPFSHQRVTFNNIFVADLFYTLPLLVCAIALLLIRTVPEPVEPDIPGEMMERVIADQLNERANRIRRKRKRWNTAGLILSTAYLLFTFVSKWSANSKFTASLDEQKISYSRFFSTPTPLNSFLWMGVAEADSGYHIGYYSIFDSDAHVKFNFIPRNEELLSGHDPKMIADLKWFANNYYCVTQNDSITYFNDIRFGQFPGWEDPHAPFAFAFDINKANTSRALNRGRFKGTIGENFRKLLDRIKGN